MWGATKRGYPAGNCPPHSRYDISKRECVCDFSLMHWAFSFNWCTICGSIHGDNDLQSWKRGGWSSGCVYFAHGWDLWSPCQFTYRLQQEWGDQSEEWWGFWWWRVLENQQGNKRQKMGTGSTESSGTWGLTHSSSQASGLTRICEQTSRCSVPTWLKLLSSAFLAFQQYRLLHNQQPTALTVLYLTFTVPDHQKHNVQTHRGSQSWETQHGDVFIWLTVVLIVLCRHRGSQGGETGNELKATVTWRPQMGMGRRFTHHTARTHASHTLKHALLLLLLPQWCPLFLQHAPYRTGSGDFFSFFFLFFLPAHYCFPLACRFLRAPVFSLWLGELFSISPGRWGTKCFW